MLNSAKKEQVYQLNTRKFFKIWFSKEPHSFLGLENELRLIRERLKNPDAQITLLYSSRCLNETTLVAMRAYSHRHSITLLDFDTDVKALLTSEEDQALYHIADQEIQKTLDNTGGNLAAASDCARLIIPVLERCGIYSDCDCAMDFSQVTATIDVKAPVVIPVSGEMCFTSHNPVLISSNNDFIAPTMDPNNPDKLSPEAIDTIRMLQRTVIQNHAHPRQAILPTQDSKHPLFLDYPQLKLLVDIYFKVNPDSDLFRFRRFIRNLSLKQYFSILPKDLLIRYFKQPDLTGLTEEELAIRFMDSQSENSRSSQKQNPAALKKGILAIPKYALTMLSEADTSGPGCFSAAFRKHHAPSGESRNDFVAWQAFHDLLNRHSLKANGLDKCYKGQNNMLMDPNKGVLEQIGSTFDVSWTEAGAQSKKKREARMRHAGRTLLHAFKTKKAKITKRVKRIPELIAGASRFAEFPIRGRPKKRGRSA